MNRPVHRTATALLGGVVLAALLGSAPGAGADEPGAPRPASTRAAGKATPLVDSVELREEATPGGRKVRFRFVVWRAKGTYAREARVRVFERRPNAYGSGCERQNVVDTIGVPVRGAGTYSTSTVPTDAPGSYAWQVTVPGDAENETVRTACRTFRAGYYEPRVEVGIADPQDTYTEGDRVRARISVEGMDPDYAGRAKVELVEYAARKGCPAFAGATTVLRTRVTGPSDTLTTPRVRLGRLSINDGYTFRLVLPGTASQEERRVQCTRAGTIVGGEGGVGSRGTADDPAATDLAAKRRPKPIVLMGPTGRGEFRHLQAGEQTRLAFAVWGLRGDYRKKARITIREPRGGECSRRVTRTVKVPVTGNGLIRSRPTTFFLTPRGYGTFYLARVRLPGDARNRASLAPCRPGENAFNVTAPYPRGSWVLPEGSPQVGEPWSGRIRVTGLRPDANTSATLRMYGPSSYDGRPLCRFKSPVRTVRVPIDGRRQTFRFPPTVVPEGEGFVSLLIDIRGDRTTSAFSRGCSGGNGTARVRATGSRS